MEKFQQGTSTAISNKAEPITIRTQDTWFDAPMIAHQINQIQTVYHSIMKFGVHYGPAFPGSDKPTLLQSGAELLSLVFRLDLQHDVSITDLGNDHREYHVKTNVYNIVTGQRLGSGEGSATTKESKFRYRLVSLKCPECTKEAIIKGKEQYGGGWLCYRKQGGCGTKFGDQDERITHQQRGKVENPDIADQYNTVLKIAKKRADVDAIKSVTAASAFFTQDAEDFINADFREVQDALSTKEVLLFLSLTHQKIQEGLLPASKLQEAFNIVETRIYSNGQTYHVTNQLLQQFCQKLEAIQPNIDPSPRQQKEENDSEADNDAGSPFAVELAYISTEGTPHDLARAEAFLAANDEDGFMAVFERLKGM